MKFVPIGRRVLWCMVVGLAGCATPPPGHSPEAVIPAHYPGAAQEAPIAAAPEWRTLFADPHLRALIDAGIRSFKIEGRLKDLSYVKNITAYYRQRLDAELETLPDFRRASSGRTTHHFVPQPEKTFNRGATDYFVNTRHVDVGAFDSPKFTGEPIGTVLRLGRDFADVDTRNTLNNGDGIAYYDAHGELVGLRINRAEKQGAGYRLYPALSGGRLPDDLAVGTALYRNRDQEFERQLEKTSAERRIPLRLRLYESASGYALSATDDEGIVAQAVVLIYRAEGADQD